MSYQIIATVLRDPETAPHTLSFAIAVARVWNAHLQVFCIGDHAESLIQTARVNLRISGLTHDIDPIAPEEGAIPSALLRNLRYSDLTVLPSPFCNGAVQADLDLLEQCLFGADVPVLVLPRDAEWHRPPARLMLAWDNGDKALAAARAALPLAKVAELTEICVIDRATEGPERSDPGGRLAQMLARVGAHVEITVAASLSSGGTDSIARHAQARHVDMIVMGAEGLTPPRKGKPGSMECNTLALSRVPVLMAH